MKRIDGPANEFVELTQNSPLDDAEKELLIGFFNAFPTVVFYRFEAPHAHFPQWLQTYETIFSGFFPAQMKWLLFHEDANLFPYTTLFTDKEYWYYFNFSKSLSSEHEEIFLEGVPLLIIATYPKTLDSILAVKYDTDPVNRSVYEFGLEAIIKNDSGQWEVPASAANIAFQSYLEMFSNIVALRENNSEPIRKDC